MIKCGWRALREESRRGELGFVLVEETSSCQEEAVF